MKVTVETELDQYYWLEGVITRLLKQNIKTRLY